MKLMAKKRQQNEPDSKGGHKNPAKLVRMDPLLWKQLDKLVKLRASDATAEIRNAVREMLERNQLWPPDELKD